MTPEEAKKRRIYKRKELQSRVTYTGHGVEVFFGSGVNLDAVAPHLIEVGDFVTITRGVYILTHDALGKIIDGRIKYGRVIISDHVSVGVGAVLMPGIRIGRGAVIGAGATVISGTDVPPGEVWAGNSARKICTVADYMKKRKTLREVPDAVAAEIKLAGGNKLLQPLETVVWHADPSIERIYEDPR